jgi:hypothetical protein
VREALEEAPIPLCADIVDYQAAPAELKRARHRSRGH